MCLSVTLLGVNFTNVIMGDVTDVVKKREYAQSLVFHNILLQNKCIEYSASL